MPKTSSLISSDSGIALIKIVHSTQMGATRSGKILWTFCTLQLLCIVLVVPSMIVADFSVVLLSLVVIAINLPIAIKIISFFKLNKFWKIFLFGIFLIFINKSILALFFCKFELSPNYWQGKLLKCFAGFSTAILYISWPVVLPEAVVLAFIIWKYSPYCQQSCRLKMR